MNDALSSHLQTLGLARVPFPPTPDAAAWFQTSHLESELVEAAHCLRARAGFVLLTGEIGTGKSTFLRRLLTTLQSEGVVTSLVFNTFLQGNDLLAAVLGDFGLKASNNPAQDVETLNHFLVKCWQAQKTCVLMIDDAQNLSIESLELLRLLTNLESGQEKLLQIILSGQPELRDNLDAPRIRQLTSRICKHVRLDPLNTDEVRAYVEFRLAAAGNEQAIRLHANAAPALHRASGGNPRRIHFIMDRCLYGLYGRPVEKRIVDARLVRASAAEAGALPARRSMRLPLALAASLAGFGVIASAAVLWRGDDAQAHAVPASIPAYAAPTTQKTVSTAREWTECIARLGIGYRQQWVNERAAAALKQAPGTCLGNTDGRWQLAWAVTPVATSEADDPARMDRIQQLLQAWGHYDGKVDGQYGPLTARALARFQQQYQLPATGQADPVTWLLLEQALASPPPNAIQMEPTPHGNG